MQTAVLLSGLQLIQMGQAVDHMAGEGCGWEISRSQIMVWPAITFVQ